MRMNRTALATAERRDLADFLETLTPEQWAGPRCAMGGRCVMSSRTWSATRRWGWEASSAGSYVMGSGSGT